MDSILVLGTDDPKLFAFLKKVGYNSLRANDKAPLAAVASDNVIDLILIDLQGGIGFPEIVEFLRANEATSDVPILVVGAAPEHQLYLGRTRGVEAIEGPAGIGSIASRIATLLRLRKFAGADERSATLGEMNATLRDLNARYQKEIEEARVIQQSLLPASLPADPRLDVAVSYRPLDEVGGDWYDVQSKGSGIAMQIADVTGHGLAAALICSMTRLALSAANRTLPDELLKEANRLMAPQLPQGRFVTMASCLYDPATGGLDFARAGHPPGLLLKRAEGKVVQLLGDGFPVGFFDEGEYSRTQATLDPEDALVMLTDGITEAQDRNRANYGIERASAALLATGRGADAGQIMEQLLADFESFRDGRILKDDVTLIVLRRIS